MIGYLAVRRRTRAELREIFGDKTDRLIKQLGDKCKVSPSFSGNAEYDVIEISEILKRRIVNGTLKVDEPVELVKVGKYSSQIGVSTYTGIYEHS